MSKKLFSLFLAVVMLALAIPAAVLPAFAAGAAPTIAESFSTKTDYTAESLLTGSSGGVNQYDDTAYFLRWYNGDTMITQHGADIPENAVAKINPTLIEEGIVSENDTFADAFAKWQAYIERESALTFKDNWAVGNMNDDDNGVFDPISALAYFDGERAFNMDYTTNKLDAAWNNRYYVAKAGSNDLFASMKNRLKAAGIGESTLVKNIAVTRAAASSGNAVYGCGNAYEKSALAQISGGYLCLIPGTNKTGARLGAVQWTSTHFGCATIKLDELSYQGGSETDFAVYHNGTRLTNFTVVTDAASANNAIGNLEIPVIPGDTIELVFARTSTPTLIVGATVEVDTGRVPVVYKRGDAVLQSTLVQVGDPLPQLIGVPDFGKGGGYMINGRFFATLPETVGEGMLIEDYTISTSASMTITTRYILNVYVHADAEAIGAGILVSGRYMQGEKQADGTYKVAALHVNAKELQTASVTYKAYQVYEDGYRISGAEKTVDSKTLLEAYATGNYDATTKALATGILDFAETLNLFLLGDSNISDAAKNRLKGDYTIPGNWFSGKNDVYLATIQQLSTGKDVKYGYDFKNTPFVPDPSVTAADKVNMGFADGTDPRDAKYKYALTGANLNYRDQIGFAFRVEANGENSIDDLKAGGSYKLRVDFSPRNYVYYDAFIADGENGKVVIVDGVPASLYGQDMYFTIVEKQADGSYAFVSATMTYSVRAYAVSTFQFSEYGIRPYFAQAIFRLSVLADEYVAAHQ